MAHGDSLPEESTTKLERAQSAYDHAVRTRQENRSRTREGRKLQSRNDFGRRT